MEVGQKEMKWTSSRQNGSKSKQMQDARVSPSSIESEPTPLSLTPFSMSCSWYPAGKERAEQTPTQFMSIY